MPSAATTVTIAIGFADEWVMISHDWHGKPSSWGVPWGPDPPGIKVHFCGLGFFPTYFDDEWGVKMGLVFLEDSSSGIKYLIWYQVVESSCKSFYKPPKHTYIQSP